MCYWSVYDVGIDLLDLPYNYPSSLPVDAQRTRLGMEDAKGYTFAHKSTFFWTYIPLIKIGGKLVFCSNTRVPIVVPGYLGASAGKRYM